MAFTGITVKQIADNKVRVTASLASVATGTIGLAGATGSAPDVKLPASFDTLHYVYPAEGAVVPFQDAIHVSYVQSAGSNPNVNVAKSGSTVADFRITFTEVGSASHTLDIIVEYH